MPAGRNRKVSEVMCDQRVSARTKGEVRAAIVKRQGAELKAAEVKMLRSKSKIYNKTRHKAETKSTKAFNTLRTPGLNGPAGFSKDRSPSEK